MAPKRGRPAPKPESQLTPTEFLEKAAGAIELIAVNSDATASHLKSVVKAFYDKGEASDGPQLPIFR